jgi:hypothetical protein
MKIGYMDKYINCPNRLNCLTVPTAETVQSVETVFFINQMY